MPAFIDISGQRFGRLTVRARTANKGRDVAWTCVCDCGNTTEISTHALRTGNTSSCGCLRLERISTHGGTKMPEYGVWKQARARCHVPSACNFKNYGARGIRMHDEWRESFAAFLRDVGRRPSSRHSLDRINNDGHYEPGNVRWATQKQQANNTRQNNHLTHRGETLTHTQWAELFNLNPTTLRNRLDYGWTAQEALTTPPDRHGNRHDSRRYTLDGVTRTIPGWARHLGIHPSSLRERIEKWPLRRALTSGLIPFDPHRVQQGRQGSPTTPAPLSPEQGQG